jgi:hypothetical protein
MPIDRLPKRLYPPTIPDCVVTKNSSIQFFTCFESSNAMALLVARFVFLRTSENRNSDNNKCARFAISCKNRCNVNENFVIDSNK